MMIVAAMGAIKGTRPPRLVWPHPLTVACPYCPARPGQPCQAEPMKRGHRERTHLARMQ
jgi:hypothetical protein